MKKKLLSCFLVLCMITTIISAIPIIANAATSGQCGDNVYWTLDDNGTLTISGSGEMTDWTLDPNTPWDSLEKNIINVIIENGVTSIGDLAFFECYSIKSVTIPNSVTSIGDGAFCRCNSLTNVTIPESVTNIGDGAFFECSSLTNVTIPERVTSINAYAFYYCTNLTNVIIPNSVTSIGDLAFWCCDSLTNVTIPESVTSIGVWAFRDCSSLTSVTIPNSVTNIANDAFSSCNSLKSINVVSSNEKYSSENGVLFNKNKTILIFCPEGKSGSYTIPNSVTIIGAKAFDGCSNLTNITIPNSVTSIGVDAFSGCRSLTNVTIPNRITTIADCAFDGCRSLTSVTIPESVTSIGGLAFGYCSSLTSVTIPNRVTSIGNNAFVDCNALTDVYYSGTKEQWQKISIGSSNDNLLNATIHYNYQATEDIIKEKHDITVEVRDAATNKLIPDSSIYIRKNADNAKFYSLTNGKITIKDVEFPIYQMGVNAWGYDFHKSYSNISYPETGKIVFAMVSKESQKVPAQGVKIFNKIDKMNVGETHQLEAWVTPLNASDKSITWSSSDPNVATVDGNGLVTAKSKGIATITAISNDGPTESFVLTIGYNYENFIYNFDNSADSFGYSENWPYIRKIPLERYLQVGYPENVARKKVEKWGG